ncbi:MAG TPA: hypothetical protein ENN09_02945 [Planctomycetes bacterium]|nr:hypothetical protein [Planctomycetota bacterium]
MDAKDKEFIQRFFDELLDNTEKTALDEKLRSDTRFARTFAENAANNSILYELAGEGGFSDAAPSGTSSTRRRGLARRRYGGTRYLKRIAAFSAAVIGVAAMAFWVARFWAVPPAPVGEIYMSGGALITSSGGTPTPAKPGGRIFAGDTLTTPPADRSAHTVLHASGGAFEINVAPATVIRISRTGIFMLESGMIYICMHRALQAAVTIKTGTGAEINVTGTRFLLSTDGTVTTLMMETSEAVMKSGGGEQKVSGGETVSARKEQPPSPPSRLDFSALWRGRFPRMKTLEATLDKFGEDSWLPIDDEGCQTAWRIVEGNAVEETSNAVAGDRDFKRLGGFLAYMPLQLREFHAEVTVTCEDDDVVGFRFAYRSPTDFFQVRLHQEEKRCTLERCSNGNMQETAVTAGNIYVPKQSFRLEISVFDGRVRVRAGGNTLIDAGDVDVETGIIGLISIGNDKVVYRDVRIVYEEQKVD